MTKQERPIRSGSHFFFHDGKYVHVGGILDEYGFDFGFFIKGLGFSISGQWHKPPSELEEAA